MPAWALLPAAAERDVLAIGRRVGGQVRRLGSFAEWSRLAQGEAVRRPRAWSTAGSKLLDWVRARGDRAAAAPERVAR
jgi:hypothetical protein